MDSTRFAPTSAVTYAEKDEEDGGDKEKGMSFERRLLKARVIMAAEVVTDKLFRRMAALALVMQEEDAKAPITVIINSPGGSADSGFAIHDMLHYLRCPVRCVVNGLCASAAVMILLAAPKERRYSLPNSRFLLHQPSTTIMGQASDIEINANEILKLKERYNQIVSDETGRPLDQIAKDADRDFWLEAVRAQEYGLVGRVIKNSAEIEK
ncbi:MAG: ATP-dependent Clp protease proteolytic subunit [Planctomycetes bacterium]|nr:ATP-dependent Clp protease proteolytic subunit [Planctomycetota bacterium]